MGLGGGHLRLLIGQLLPLGGDLILHRPICRARHLDALAYLGKSLLVLFDLICQNLVRLRE